MTNFPTSDIQFIAQILIKIRAGDQVTALEDHRIRQIAGTGSSDQPMFPRPEMDFANNSQGLTAEELASATRAGGAQIDVSH